MKIRKLLLAMVLMLVGASTASAAVITTTGTKPDVGNGNSDSPYEIRTAEELRWFVHYENTRHWYPNDHAKLMCDIDLSSICGPDKGTWIPLGCTEEDGAKGYYYGDFDGNGHTISGMYQDGNDLLDDISSPGGFFGTLGGAHIKDLTVDGIIFNIGGMDAGGLAGAVCNETMKYNKIVNCESKVHFYISGILNDGDEEPTYDYKYCILGGLVGAWTEENSEDLENCVFSGEFHFSRTLSNYVGSLIGGANGRYTEISFYNCCAVTGRGFPMIGYANMYKCKINNCITDGAIVGNLAFVDTESSPRFTGNVYCYNYGLYERRVGRGVGDLHTDSGNAFVSPDAIANGNVCYTLNEMMGGQHFTQTLDTDKVPYPNSAHATVYRVKDYTNCKDYNYRFTNSPEDITTNRKHSFVDGSETCSNCDAPNPSSHTHDGDYYLLSKKDDVLWFWNMANEQGITELKVRLTADIDMAGEPLSPLKTFMGEIDGAGHTLSGLNISNSGSSDAGLVGCLKDGGYVHDLTIAGCVMASGSCYAGGFAGRVMDGTLRNLRNDCSIVVDGSSCGSTARVGGIVGSLAGTAERCINNGTVTYLSQNFFAYANGHISGVVGFAESTAKMSLLANNALVGASIYAGTAICMAIANYASLEQAPEGMYYVNDISNPGYNYFGSSKSNPGETAITQTAVGSGELCYLLCSGMPALGQTIGTDLVPCPGVSDAHKQVYNTRHYYNCTEYASYSNSENNEAPIDSHNYNADGYCTLCYHANVSQDYRRIYQIGTAADWNCYAKALNAANTAGAAGRFASAALTQDITLDASDFTTIGNLWGNIYGQGHTVTLSNAPAHAYCLIDRLRGTGSLFDLNVQLTGASNSIISENVGKVSACSAIGGQIYLTNYGLATDCYADQPFAILEDGSGYLTRCLQCTETAGEKQYTVLSKMNNTAACYLNEVFSQKQQESGELAYYISHLDKTQPCVWGEELGTDSHPKPYYGQTPTSSTYVTNLITYSAEHPEGKVEYVNAGKGLEATPGCYKVCKDIESWTARPAYNFIIDKGDGTYTAEHINIDPTMQNYLPISVQADKLTFKEANSEGELVAKDYGFGEILSLVFPVAMPVSNVNGHVHVFDGYDALNNTLVFTSSLDEGDCTIPANTPVLVKTYGGGILNADLTNVTIEPMAEAGYSELENVRHLTNYYQQVLPTDKALEDGGYVLYYVLNGDKALLATNNTNTVGQFASYFLVPYISASSTQSEIGVALVEDRELKTARIIERDLFSIPYGSIDENAEWQKVSHLSDPNVFYGNDITCDNYANISAYDFLYIHGKPGQKYYFYFNGSDATEVAIDNDGDAFIELDEHRVGIGDVYLRGIRLAEGETVADDAFAKVYKYLEEGLVLYGYGDFSDDLKGYPFYDATGVKCGITLNLDNPNAMVVGGSNVKGVYNRIEKSEDVMQGFTAEKLRLTDGGDFCYDYSVKCPQVTFTRYDVPEGMRYVTFVLPFAAKYVKGMHEYIDCDGENVYFNTPEDGVIDAYLPIVIDMEEYEGRTITITGEDFLALSPNGTFNVAPVPSTKYDLKYGFVKKEQQNVPLTNAEVADYDIYNFSTNSYQFVRATDTFSISPFRAFFMLPKSTATRVNGFAAPVAECKVLNIVLDGEEITTGITNINVDDAGVGNTYNILGQPVGSGYRGIIIRNGEKIIIK